MKKITKELLQKEVVNYLTTFKPKIKDILEKSVLSLIGLEKRYDNNYEIDHCNGRNSVLIDAFRQIAKDEAKKIVNSYKPTKEDIVNFKSAVEKEYESQFNYAIRDIIKIRVNKEMETLLDSMKIDIEDLVNEVMSKK